MKRYALIITIALSCTLALFGCGKKKNENMDLSSTHTTAAKETMASTTLAPESVTETKEETAAEKETKSTAPADKKDEVKSVSTSLHTYTSGNISIEYPVVANLTSSSVQDKVNQLLNTHALEIVNAYSIDGTKDTLTVHCKVVSADRKRITAVYTGTYSPEGAAYPTSVFYTNTVNTAWGEDMGLTSYADPYTLAGYVLSNDCQFYNVSEELKTELMKLRLDTDIESYTDLFRHADFPFKESGTNGNGRESDMKFPEIFSYEDQGTIFISLPVPHVLGDYALIQYTPDTK